MRIACIYLPSLPLQSVVRQRPSLADKAVIVCSGANPPLVIARSRRARELGVGVGMTIPVARSHAPESTVVIHEPDVTAAAKRSLADALLQLSDVVDVGHAAGATLYLSVPTGIRGATFGKTILAKVTRQGLRARVGIADDRFSARVAAVVGTSTSKEVERFPASAMVDSCVSVPRGGAAAFLAPLPIHLLPLGENMRDVLRALRVNTIGQFAELPPPVGPRLNDSDVDFLALARGDGPTALHSHVPSGPIVETAILEHSVHQTEPLWFILRPLSDRVSARLAGRGVAAAKVCVRLMSATDPSDARMTEIDLQPTSATASGRELMDLARRQIRLNHAVLPHEVRRIDVVISGQEERVAPRADLFADVGRVERFAGLDRAPRRTKRGKNRPRIRRPRREAQVEGET